jgi:hypothetical protein
MISIGLLASATQAAILATATPGVTLTLTSSLGNPPMEVTYVPTFQRYYGGSGNGPGVPAAIFDSAGVQVGNASSGVDLRGMWFNANTGFLESNSYNACCGSGAVTGIQHINLDGSGNYVGTNTQLVAGPLAGLGGNSQTLASYDPAGNVLYSKQGGSANVTVANRASGALVTTITLNLAAAGVTPSDINDNFVGFTGVAGSELVSFDFTNHRALVFNLAGNYIGASILPAITPTFDNQDYGAGYANGQLFVFDDSIGGAGGAWRGFVILGNSASLPVPTMTDAGLCLLGVLVVAVAAFGLRRRESV